MQRKRIQRLHSIQYELLSVKILFLGLSAFCISMDQLRGIENFDEQKKKHTSFLLMFFMSTAVKTKSLCAYLSIFCLFFFFL